MTLNSQTWRLSALAIMLSMSPASAQGIVAAPPGGAPNSLCMRLEGQLAAIDRGLVDPAQAEQIKRYEDTANKQQFELDRLIAQSRHLGCEGMGLFSIFSSQNPQCPQLNRQIQQMRTHLDGTLAALQRLQSGSDREAQRQNVIAALAQNNCGPQYRAAANQQRGFFDTLFGTPSATSPAPEIQSSTYRTLCVRTCDGYYFPISFATTPAKFHEDEQACRRMCPAAEVVLVTHRNPGEDINQALSLAGKPYSELPNAFRYRREYNPACSCRRPGQSWADALGQIRDTTIERGDIVVTEERAKVLSLPRDAQGRPLRQDTRQETKKADSKPGVAAPQTSAAPALNNAPVSTGGQRQVRTVGPPFVPTQ